MKKQQQGSLLIVDDDPHILEAMADYLGGLGYHATTSSCCQDAFERMNEYLFDVAICDVNLPDLDGFHLLEWATENRPETAVILLTGYGTIESAVEAIRIGAFDYLTKPVLDEELNLSIQRAIDKRRIVEENQQLKAQLTERFGLSNIVGHDYKMLKMFDLIESVADTRTTVLILGESGTGKTITARAIHQLSNRRVDEPSEDPFGGINWARGRHYVVIPGCAAQHKSECKNRRPKKPPNGAVRLPPLTGNNSC